MINTRTMPVRWQRAMRMHRLAKRLAQAYLPVDLALFVAADRWGERVWPWFVAISAMWVLAVACADLMHRAALRRAHEEGRRYRP